jgi:two-component system, OmpR family, KDP operon response regulator KdpE
MARILVVEDDALVRHSFVTLLKSDGHLVAAAASGHAALAAAASEPPDVAVLDVGLPDIDGIECASRLRQARLQAPIIFLTAYGGAEFVARAIEQRAYAYLVKPIAGNQLLPLVRTALSAALAEQQKEGKLLAALSDSREISAAVGMLAERNGWPLEKAFDALRMMARSECRRVVEVAADITKRLR